MAKTPFSPTEYATRKQARRAAQQAKVNAIAALPAEVRAMTMLEQWPQKLPKGIDIPKGLRLEWHYLKSSYDLFLMGEFDEKELNTKIDDSIRMQVAQDSMQTHGRTIGEILALINALPGTKVVSVKAVDPASDNLDDPDHISGDAELSGSIEKSIQIGVLPIIAMGLAAEGFIQVCHTLTKTVTRKNDAGVMETVRQVCLYGIHLSKDDGMALVSAKQLREMLGTDEDGDPVTFLPEVSFGSFETLIRNAKDAAKARGGATLH
jgi:hypothetical protein